MDKNEKRNMQLDIDETIVSAEACFMEELNIFDVDSKKCLLLASIAQSALAIAKMLNEWRKADK